MAIEDAALGRLTKEHLKTHNQVTRQKAELEQIGENLILLGTSLKTHPQDIDIADAKIMLRHDHAQERTILRTGLDMSAIIQTLQEFQQATQQGQQLVHRLEDAGMKHIVQGLSNRQPKPTDIPTR